MTQHEITSLISFISTITSTEFIARPYLWHTHIYTTLIFYAKNISRYIRVLNHTAASCKWHRKNPFPILSVSYLILPISSGVFHFTFIRLQTIPIWLPLGFPLKAMKTFYLSKANTKVETKETEFSTKVQCSFGSSFWRIYINIIHSYFVDSIKRCYCMYGRTFRMRFLTSEKEISRFY